jgi:Fibronectin type III domain
MKKLMVFSVFIAPLAIAACLPPAGGHALEPPATPGGLLAVAKSSSSIEAVWTDKSDTEDRFVFAYGKDSGFAGGATELSVPANTESRLVEGLEANTTYYFRLKAVNAAGSSAWSNSAEAVTGVVMNGTMIINSGSAYTAETTVTIFSTITAAAEMRLQNTNYASPTPGPWSEWEPYAATRTWHLMPGDGEKIVTAEYRDAYGVVLPMYDSIILDTTPPSGTFSVNTGETWAWTTAATLNMNMTGAVQMRFKNDTNAGTWPGWGSYATSQSWTITEGENTYRIVYGQFMDNAGNMTETTATIYYDRIRRLKITAEYITITTDGNASGPGQLFWNFFGWDTDDTLVPIYNSLSEGYHALNDGETWDFADATTLHSVLNVPGQNLTIAFQIFESESPNPPKVSTRPEFIYYPFTDWGIGDTRPIRAAGTPSAYMYFKIEKVD